MLLTFEHVQGRFQDILTRWFKHYEILSPAINSYFSAKTDSYRYIDGRFLALVQALEIFHRRLFDTQHMNKGDYENLVQSTLKNCPKDHIKWLSDRLERGNEYSLCKRLKEIAKPCIEYLGNSRNREKLIRKLTDTRNHLTHYDIENTAPVTGEELLFLCRKMEAIFQINLLKLIGFNAIEIGQILNDNQDIKTKLHS